MPLGAALDAIYSIYVENMKTEDRIKFDAMLDKPLKIPGRKLRPADQAKAISDFEAIAGPRPTSGVTASAERSDSAHPKTPRQPQPPHQDGPSTEPRKQPGRRA